MKIKINYIVFLSGMLGGAILLFAFFLIQNFLRLHITTSAEIGSIDKLIKYARASDDVDLKNCTFEVENNLIVVRQKDAVPEK